MTAKKPKVKLEIWDQRMLQFMEHCLSSGVCSTQRNFLISIGFIPENIGQLRNGRQSFTLQHIHAAAIKYGLNLNWIMGLDSEMRRKPGRSAIQQLKDAVKTIELSL